MVTAQKTGGTEGDIVEMVRKRVGFNELRPERHQLEDAMLIQLMYYSGKQQFYYEQRQFIDAVQYADPEMARYQINLMRSRILDACARVLNVNAEFRARPEGASAKQRELAALSDRVYDHIRIVTDFEHVRSLAELWAAITGAGYLYCQWDPTIGEPDRFYKLDRKTSAVIPEVLLTPDMREEKDRDGLFEDLPKGDLKVSCESPFSIYEDTSARDAGVAGCRWIARRHWVDVDVVAEHFDMDVKDIPTDEPTQGIRNYEEAIAFMSTGVGISPYAWAVPPDKQGKRTNYTEMWERPSRLHPRGRRICLAGTTVLNYKRRGGLDNPYAGDRSGWAHLPFVKVDWVEQPGRWTGSGLAEDMMSAQHYLNKSRSLVAQFQEDRGLPDTFISDSSGLDTDNMRAGGGKIYKISDQAAARGVLNGPVPQMPREVAEFGSVALNDLNMAAAQSPVDAAKLPGQVRSGSGIRAINEDRFMSLTFPARNSVRAARDAGRCLLAIGKLYYGKGRLLKYQDGGAEWVVEEFSGADLVTDLQITAEPSVTDTIGTRRAEMLDMVQAQAFDPTMREEDREMLFAAMALNAPVEFVARKLSAKRHAELVIHELSTDFTRWIPEGYPVFEWQEHAREAREVVAYMYTNEFRRLDPMAQSLITKYWKDCVSYVQLAEQRQLELQAALKGTPGQKGQASQPAR